MIRSAYSLFLKFGIVVPGSSGVARDIFVDNVTVTTVAMAHPRGGGPIWRSCRTIGRALQLVL